MTVAYALPDGTEFVSTYEDHPLVVARRAAGVVSCDSWTGPTHELIVNEDIVRTMARQGAALVVTFTRSKMDTGETSADVDQGGTKSDGTSSRRRRSSWRRWFSDRSRSPSACTTPTTGRTSKEARVRLRGRFRPRSRGTGACASAFGSWRLRKPRQTRPSMMTRHSWRRLNRRRSFPRGSRGTSARSP